MGLLSGWDEHNRLKLTIDHTKIISTLTHFQVLLYLSSSSGITNRDVTAIFDELGSDANRKKIAVTKSDGVTQLYVEIEKWSDATEKAWLWVSRSGWTISSTVATILYIYFDSSHADNTAYVGDPSDAVVHNVWKTAFKVVSHMQDDPNTSSIRDSTVNANDGTKVGANQPIEVAGKIGDAQGFDGINDDIRLDSKHTFTANNTLMFWAKVEAQNYLGIISGETGNRGYLRFGWGAGQYDDNIMGETDTESDYVRLDFNSPITVGVLYHFAITQDGSKVWRLHINGVLQNDTHTTTNANLGMRKIGEGRQNTDHFKGCYDEFQILSELATTAWIKATYETGGDNLITWGESYTKILTEKLGLVDSSSRTWDIRRTFPESLGLKDSIIRGVSVTKTELLGIVDVYSRVWTIQRVYSELLGLLDTYSDVWSVYRVYTELLGLVDVYSRTWDIYRTYDDYLGLLDSVKKGYGKTLTELLGFIDTYSRVWTIYRTYSELLGLLDIYDRTWNVYRTYIESLGSVDTISKDISKPFLEYLGLLDVVAKKPDKHLIELLGFLDTIVKGSSITRTELLGLVDTTTKDIRRSFVEYLGLVDFFDKTWAISRTYTESLGLKDVTFKEVSKSFIELLGLKDWHSHTLNPLSVYEYIDKLIRLVEIER